MTDPKNDQPAIQVRNLWMTFAGKTKDKPPRPTGQRYVEDTRNKNGPEGSRIEFTIKGVALPGLNNFGKNYSGAGIDPNVVGRLLIEAAPELETNKPKITRIACLDVSPESHGNATGVGIADLTTERLLKSIGAPGSASFLLASMTAGLFVTFLWPRNRALVQRYFDSK